MVALDGRAPAIPQATELYYLEQIVPYIRFSDLWGFDRQEFFRGLGSGLGFSLIGGLFAGLVVGLLSGLGVGLGAGFLLPIWILRRMLGLNCWAPVVRDEMCFSVGL